MESITKNRQSLSTVRAMVARGYGEDQVPEGGGWAQELGHGWFNVAYQIRLRDGREVVLKIAPPADVEVMSYERGAMATELATLRLLSSSTTVPVPAVDFADQSHELCDADYFFMPFIEAENLGLLQQEGKLSPAERETYGVALGAVTRQINEVRGDWFGPLSGPGDPSWRACFLRKLQEVLGDGERRNVELGYAYNFVRGVVAAYADALDEVTQPRLVEWDLFPNNAMVRDGRIVCVIDHERAFFGDPLIEAGFTGIDLPDAYGDPAPFMRGYGVPSLTADEYRRRWLYTLYLVLIMVIETEYRGHTTTEQYDWCRRQLDKLMKVRP